jgi:hypothetical protein
MEPALIPTRQAVSHISQAARVSTLKFRKLRRNAAISLFAALVARRRAITQCANDPLPGRHSGTARRWFTEPAFDVAINERIGRGHRFKILQVTIAIFVKNDGGIEQVGRIERAPAACPIRFRRRVLCR